MSSSRLWLGVVCLACVILLLATAIPAPFSVDDCNYLSSVVGLRRGTLFVPGTEGLPPSAALYAFEPTAFILKDPQSPVPPLVPPLYALLAYPFSYLGWHGLVLLNVLATGATVLLVFTAARQLANQDRAGWYAVALWLLGASTIEYAQGLWPHMLSVALATGGMVLVAVVIASGRSWQATLSGLLLALAAGVRYQNAVLLCCGLLALVLWGAPRWRTGCAFVAGALVPTCISSFLNHARIHSWNPFSKGLHYTSVVAGGTAVGTVNAGGGAGDLLAPVREFLLTLWTRVVDYSAQPPFHDRAGTYMRKLASGDVVTAWGVVKKSWLQGSPWVLLGLFVICLAWSRKDFLSGFARSQLRRAALPIAALLTVFGLAGVYRHDGMAFNQRYLLELAPLVAIAVGVSLASLPLRWYWIASGLVLGAGAGALVVLRIEGALGYRLQSIVPLLLGCLAALLGTVSFSRPRWIGPTGLAVASCLAWSLTVHLSTDLHGSRRARQVNQRRLDYVVDALPSASPVALLAAVGPHDAFCPLLLGHDAVVVTGNDVPVEELLPVIDALLARRRVFVWLGGLPPATVSRLRETYRLESIRPPLFAEIAR
jgi:4-amino-4-deoxy-L-arabinose transferase-like glycosyltransferase